MTAKERKILILSYTIAFILSAIAVWVTFIDCGYTEVDFVDVGQGDSTLIKTQRFKTILVDGGNVGSGEFVLSSLLRAKGCMDIDAAFISHIHDDHFVGICELLDADIKIKTIYVGERADKKDEFQRLKTLAEEKQTEIKFVRCGDRISIDEITFSVLSTGCGSAVSDDENDNSVIMRCDIGENSILFTGDATEECERALDKDMICDIDILKVGHHGSKTSSSEDFIKAVNPKFGLIGVGRKNGYNLPSNRVIRQFAEMHIPILRTDYDGTIEIRMTDNDILDIESFDFE